MTNPPIPEPAHDFHRAPWILIIAGVAITLVATLAVFLVGYPK